jgi:hypothetical protein
MLTIHSNGTHTSTATPSQQYKTEKVRRPTLLTGGSSEEWSYFLTRWQDYAGAKLAFLTMTNIHHFWVASNFHYPMQTIKTM